MLLLIGITPCIALAKTNNANAPLVIKKSPLNLYELPNHQHGGDTCPWRSLSPKFFIDFFTKDYDGAVIEELRLTVSILTPSTFQWRDSLVKKGKNLFKDNQKRSRLDMSWSITPNLSL